MPVNRSFNKSPMKGMMQSQTDRKSRKNMAGSESFVGNTSRVNGDQLLGNYSGARLLNHLNSQSGYQQMDGRPLQSEEETL